MKTWKKLFALSVVLFVSACLTSCVEFEGQSMTYRYDAKKDELRIFQVYEGIYSEDGSEEITDIEKRQLGDVIMGERTFFFTNWILEYNRDLIKEQLVSAKKRLADGEDDDDDIPREVRLEMIELMELALRSVKVDNGQFYLNEDKELCAYQEVTITNVSKLVAKVNELGDLALEHIDEMDGFTQEQWDHIKKFYETAKWLELDGNRLVVLFPQSREDHFKTRKDIANAIVDGNKNIIAAMIENDVQIGYQEPILKLRIGRGGTPQTNIEIGDLFDGDYNTLVLDYVREHYTVKENLDVDEIRDAFLK